MKETYRFPSMMLRNIKRDQEHYIKGMPVLRDVQGPRCVHCGSLRYSLVFRVSEDGGNGLLVGQCSNCRNSGELAVGEIEGGCRA